MVNVGRRCTGFIVFVMLLLSGSEATAQTQLPRAPESTEAPRALDRVRFSGTTLWWSHLLSTSAAGIDQSYLTRENDLYTMSFGVRPAYFPIWTPDHKLRVSTYIGMTANLIDGREHTPPRDAGPDIDDIPLQVRHVATLYSSREGASIGGPAAMRDPSLLGGGDWSTWLIGSGSLTFPLSEQSKAAGFVLVPWLNFAVRQQIKLLGSDAPGLTHMLLATGFSWSHPFRSYPSFLNKEVPASEDYISYTLNMTVALYGGLQLSSGFGFVQSIIDWDDRGPTCALITNGECVQFNEPRSDRNRISSSQLSVSLAYLILPELAADVGYTNMGSTIGEDGRRRGVFYGPNASFTANVTLSIDRLIQRITAPRESAEPARVAHLK
jgi:hypothetical protein